MTIIGDDVRTEMRGSNSEAEYSPIVVRTGSIHRASEPAAFDCVRIIVVRDGSAFLHGDFGKEPVSVGHIAVLGADVRCTMEPEGHITSTVIFVDPDYIADQVFWQYAHALHDRLDAKEFFAALYSEPAQVLKIGEERVGLLMPWLDEMASLSTKRELPECFLRMQALWFSVADAITPHIRVSKTISNAAQQPQSRPTLPRSRRFEPMREEALMLRRALKEDLARPWKLSDMAAMVHLSTKQLTRVFSTAFGKTPQAYLTILRVEEMARLLRETDVSVADAGRMVGWRSRSRATEAFHECTGHPPKQYREIRRSAAAS
ncbi:AraC family transcriptional regulator [Kocuria palustris]|uniref:helix-turn-helix domain-containing protein n=1 Tax=Kocuria palustris TaxID=71999 RepID=UPI0021A5F587|nr:AraC family transcriptional regulator [Kocuria palustris]MCT1833300.1 AraC family transcriptional regulator [Kocuria palustris]MDH5150868.1 AraC family transcriptional regulator [Kocuria palustris]